MLSWLSQMLIERCCYRDLIAILSIAMTCTVNDQISSDIWVRLFTRIALISVPLRPQSCHSSQFRRVFAWETVSLSSLYSTQLWKSTSSMPTIATLSRSTCKRAQRRMPTFASLSSTHGRRIVPPSLRIFLRNVKSTSEQQHQYPAFRYRLRVILKCPFPPCIHAKCTREINSLRCM